tara:strand:- start:4456 stop:4728 length:273 start_codon:yes stop_codon:yes gene_type:complete
MTQSDAEFDRALGAWEDSQLNAHLAKGEEWDFAYDEAQGVVWDMNLNRLYKMAPVGVERKIEGLVDDMSKHITELILNEEFDPYEGGWDD